MSVTHSSRRIETVKPVQIGMLDQAGKLPERYGLAKGKKPERDATIPEVCALTWIVEWEGRSHDTVGGFAAYRDVYDYHTGSEVREVVCIAGSKRSVVDLLKYMCGSARAAGRRCVGAVDVDNTAMRAVLEGLGYTQTRVFFEDAR